MRAADALALLSRIGDQEARKEAQKRADAVLRCLKVLKHNRSGREFMVKDGGQESTSFLSIDNLFVAQTIL